MSIITKYIVLFVLCAFSFYSALSQSLSTNIRLNQIGFYPNNTKIAVIAENPAAGDFTIKSTNRASTYFTGTLSTSDTWSYSSETLRIADFSAFNTAGTFVLDIAGIGYSYPFVIHPNVFYELTKGSMKAFYFQRSSTALPTIYAGAYARAAGHADNNVIVLPSAASTSRPAGTVLSMPKGWYDAGDYNSYIVNSGISTYTLLATYEHYKAYWDTISLNIPESANSMPDILDEIKWNLDWMLTMQDPEDGGVYNKKTNAGFDGYIMPSAATTPRYVCAKGTAAAFDFAAVMAAAYRIYKPYDLAYANTCLAAAESAWNWGIANFNVPFTNPVADGAYPTVVTGGYGDNSFFDEREWASNELYIATGSESYYPYGYKTSSVYTTPYWGSVRVLGLISLLHHRKNLTTVAFADTADMKLKMLAIADPLRDHQNSASAYKVAMGTGADFVWGSNSSASNQAFMLLAAYEISNDVTHYNAALANLDYLLGRNATTYSFVTGFGSKTPLDPHMRISKADGIANPVPGWIVGGPQNTNTPDGCGYAYTEPARRYIDNMCSYSTNEMAINWNAPLVFIASGIEALNPFANDPFLTSTINAIESDQNNNYLLYPNPTKGSFSIVCTENTNEISIGIFNTLGEKVLDNKEISDSKNMSIDLSTLPNGIYVIQIQQENKTTFKKIIKE